MITNVGKRAKLPIILYGALLLTLVSIIVILKDKSLLNSVVTGTSTDIKDTIPAQHETDTGKLSMEHKSNIDYTRAMNSSDNGNRTMHAVIHVGPHKTGSSSLQQYLYNSAKVNLTQADRDRGETDILTVLDNYIHPVVPCAQVWYLKTSCLAGSFHKGSRSSNSKFMMNWLEQFVAHSSKAGSNIIMSSEEFDRPTINVTKIAEYFVPYQVHIVVAYRRFFDITKSWYSQENKWGFIRGSNGKRIIISYVNWLSNDKIDELKKIFSFDVYHRFKQVPSFNVSIMNSYQNPERSTQELFFCDHVPGANHTCAMAMSNKKSMVLTSNLSVEDDIMAWEAFASQISQVYPKLEYHLNFRFNWWKREPWWKGYNHWITIQQKYKTMMDSFDHDQNPAPTICLSDEIRERLLALSIEYETALFSEEFLDSENGLEALKVEFDKKIEVAGCTLDIESILSTQDWQEFLNGVVENLTT